MFLLYVFIGHLANDLVSAVNCVFFQLVKYQLCT